MHLNYPNSLGRRKAQLTAISFIWQALFFKVAGRLNLCHSNVIVTLNVIGKFAKGALCDSLIRLWCRFWKIKGFLWATGVLFSLTTASQVLISCWLNSWGSSDNFQRLQPPICPAHPQLPNEAPTRYTVNTLYIASECSARYLISCVISTSISSSTKVKFLICELNGTKIKTWMGTSGRCHNRIQTRTVS